MKALRQYMEATGLNQSKLAERVGVSRSTITLWLQGKRAPTDDRLDIISARTGIDRKKLTEEHRGN